MSKRVKAVATGFRGGKRIREGTVFSVPDKAKAKWYIDYPEALGASIVPADLTEKKVDIADLI